MKIAVKKMWLLFWVFFFVSTTVTTELSTGPSLAPPNVSEFNIPLYHSCKSSLLAPSLTWFVRSLPAPHLCGELVNFNIACTACSKPRGISGGRWRCSDLLCVLTVHVENRAGSVFVNVVCATGQDVFLVLYCWPQTNTCAGCLYSSWRRWDELRNLVCFFPKPIKVD